LFRPVAVPAREVRDCSQAPTNQTGGKGTVVPKDNVRKRAPGERARVEESKAMRTPPPPVPPPPTPTPPAPMPHRPAEGRNTVLILAAILLLGAALRIGYLVEFVQYPDFRAPHVDADFHNYWARGLAFNEWTPPGGNADPLIRTTPFFRPPGYPYFLALLYKLLGHGYLWPRVVQMLLGLLNAGLAFLLARRFFGRAVGLIWAAFMATYWVFIFFEGEFQEPILMVFLVLSLAWVLMKWSGTRSWRLSLAAGALIGLAGLVRPNALLSLPVIGLWALWVLRRRGQTRRIASTAGALVAGAVVLVSPATIRNWVVAHDFVPISSNGGINLYIGNNGRADGIVRGALPDIGVLDTCYDWPEIVNNVERKVGHPMSHGEVSGYFTRGAVRWMLAHPLGVLDLVGKKTLLFWGPVEPQDNKEVAEDRKFSRVLRRDPWNFPLALALGVCGTLLSGWEWRRLRRKGDRAVPLLRGQEELAVLLLGVGLTWYVSYLPFAITSRYRVPVIPILLFFGALFLRWIAEYLLARRYRTAACWGGLFLGVLILSHLNLAGYQSSPARWHYERGIAYNTLGKRDDAIREFQAAVEINPNYVAVYNDLGAALATAGRLAESVPCFRKSIQLSPGNAPAHCNLAACLELLGRIPESRAEYEEALRLKPGYARAQEGLRRCNSAPGSAPDSAPGSAPGSVP
jgi:4-amino-4-deoxy-L-arabinose transferase-like glycosyltransferase